MKDTVIEPVRDLYVQYAPDVYRIALSSTRCHAEAEDVVQEVFLRVLQNWESFRGDSQAKTWILRITRNYLVDAARKRNKHQRLTSNPWQSHYSTPIDTLVEVEDLLSVLPEPQRRVFDLRLIKDFSVSDTAKLLECSEGKVRTDTHRALQRLKKFAEEETAI